MNRESNDLRGVELPAPSSCSVQGRREPAALAADGYISQRVPGPRLAPSAHCLAPFLGDVRRKLSMLILAVAFSMISGHNAIADEKSAAIEPDSKASSTTPTESEKEQAERRAKGEAALYVVIGVAGVGVVMILAVLLIGWMIRRRVKRPAKCEASTNDPLWHLRNPEESRPWVDEDEL